jgi:hypothetical protein
MKIASYRHTPDGSLAPNVAIEHERMTFETFKKAYGGAPVTDQAAAKVNYVEPGYSLWKTGHGHVFAIRDE